MPLISLRLDRVATTLSSRVTPLEHHQTGLTARARQPSLTRNPPYLLHTSTDMAPLRVYGPFRLRYRLGFRRSRGGGVGHLPYAWLRRRGRQSDSRGGRALACVADVNDLERLPEVVDRTVAEFGRLDVLVNCAGGGYHWHPFKDIRVEQLEKALHFTVRLRAPAPCGPTSARQSRCLHR
jgi:hypothetical protein